jgi:hypothetical protein
MYLPAAISIQEETPEMTQHKHNETFDGPLTHRYEDVKRFATDPVLQTRLKRDNFAEYLSFKADWRKCPELRPPGENSREFGERVRATWAQAEKSATNPTRSEEELYSRFKWSEETANAIVRDNDATTGHRIGKMEPLAYQELMVAYHSYRGDREGVERHRAKVLELSRVPEPVEPEKTYTLWPDLAEAVGMPSGSKVDHATFTNAISVSVKLREEREQRRIRDLAKQQIEQETEQQAK